MFTYLSWVRSWIFRVTVRCHIHCPTMAPIKNGLKFIVVHYSVCRRCTEMSEAGVYVFVSDGKIRGKQIAYFYSNLQVRSRTLMFGVCTHVSQFNPIIYNFLCISAIFLNTNISTAIAYKVCVS